MKHHSSDKRSDTLSGANSRSPTQPASWSARSAREANKTAGAAARALKGWAWLRWVGVALMGWAWRREVLSAGGGIEMSRVKGKGSRQGCTVVCDFASVSRVGE